MLPDEYEVAEFSSDRLPRTLLAPLGEAFGYSTTWSTNKVPDNFSERSFHAREPRSPESEHEAKNTMPGFTVRTDVLTSPISLLY